MIVSIRSSMQPRARRGTVLVLTAISLVVLLESLPSPWTVDF